MTGVILSAKVPVITGCRIILTLALSRFRLTNFVRARVLVIRTKYRFARDAIFFLTSFPAVAGIEVIAF